MIPLLHRRRHSSRRQRGQSMAEFALGFTVLMLLVSGLLDLGRAYYVFVALEDGAGEAALFLSINPHCVTSAGGPRCANPNNAIWRAKNAGGGGGFVNWASIADSDVNVVISDNDGDPSTLVGETVTVTIPYQFELLTPIMPHITGLNPITLRGVATQVIVKQN